MLNIHIEFARVRFPKGPWESSHLALFMAKSWHLEPVLSWYVQQSTWCACYNCSCQGRMWLSLPNVSHLGMITRDWDLAGLLEGEWEATFWIALGAVVREGWEERGWGLLGSGVPVSLVLDDSVLPSCLSQSCHVHINTCVSRLWFCLILFLTDGEEMPARALTYADFILHGCFLGQVHLTAYCVECFCSFSKPGVNCSRVWMPHALIVLVRRLLLCQENVYLYCWLFRHWHWISTVSWQG